MGAKACQERKDARHLQSSCAICSKNAVESMDSFVLL